MPKLLVFLAVACVAGLPSCIPPPPPIPHFRPLPPAPPVVPDPYGNPPPPPDLSPPVVPDPVPANGDYPTAKPTDNPDQVISPYAPYNVIDVAGFTSGKLARDPSNQKIFRVP